MAVAVSQRSLASDVAELLLAAAAAAFAWALMGLAALI